MKWTRVGDDLPERGLVVLVWYKPADLRRDDPGWFGTAFYARTEGWGWTRSDGNRANDLWGTVTHWSYIEGPEASE